jgi:hypothetical protein
MASPPCFRAFPDPAFADQEELAMTEVPSLPDATDEVAIAVRNLMPDLRKIGAWTAALMAAIAVVVAVVTLMIASSAMDGEDRFKGAFITLGIGSMIIFYCHRWMIGRQEATVMPVLARSIGLRYDKDARSFLHGLPARLLPKGVRKAEDHVHGNLGAHAIRMAEVNVETGGKHSRTLFKGIVAQFPNRVAMPAFFIALEDKTRPGIFFGGSLSTDGLHHLRTVLQGGRAYGVWTSWTQIEEPPALSAVIDVLTRIENHVGHGAQLYAATSNGEEMHIALSHSRNLFRVGGMFPSEKEIFADVRAAMQDLSVPITLAQHLIQAEESAVAKAVPAPVMDQLKS